MSKINVLDKNTIDKIAAGEVIDRPASIVKEMLENSIDAGSTSITVEIKDGGTSLIRITDNGGGISKDDIRLAFTRHATSKIKSVEDLLTVSSLGFRGEALSSIGSVAQVECISKTPGDMVGLRYIYEGGEEKSLEEVGAPSGTTFVVRNLFYNTPARRKFLKTSATEASYISAAVEHLAMSHPEVSIRFINNSNNKLHTAGNNNLKDIIYTIFGKDITTNLIEIDLCDRGMKLKGYIGKPVISRGNRNFMNYYINNRFIKSKTINSAIEDAYKPFMMQHNYPFCVLHFEIDQRKLDVNVHPSKMELRFEDPADVYDFFFNAVSQALKKREMIPEASLGKKYETNVIPRFHKSNPKIDNLELDKYKKSNSKIDNSELDKYKKSSSKINNSELDKKDSIPAPKRYAEPFEINRQSIINEKEEYYSAEQKKDLNEIKQIEKAEQLTFFDDNFLSKEARVRHKLIGQVFDTYWIVEYDKQMYIIDQHAAHEKVLYERTLKAMKEKEFTTQMINPPIILTLNDNEVIVLKKFLKNFEELGYEIESFGGNDFAVRGVPANLYSIGSKELLMELIDSLTTESSSLKSEIINDKIATMSCKAAVKGNNTLSEAEINTLIDELLSLDNPYNCPHGRPTIISMSKYELEKKFKRII